MTWSIENSLPNMKDCNLPLKETKLSIKIAFDSLGQTWTNRCQTSTSRARARQRQIIKRGLEGTRCGDMKTFMKLNLNNKTLN